jgi:hypothetical protein
MDQDNNILVRQLWYMMEEEENNCEEKTRIRSDLQAPAVHQRGGDVQPNFTPQETAGPRSR